MDWTYRTWQIESDEDEHTFSTLGEALEYASNASEETKKVYGVFVQEGVYGALDYLYYDGLIFKLDI
jgi:hypothetical protein